jgi:tRNA (adenine22-N1)-methyltransferase
MDPNSQKQPSISPRLQAILDITDQPYDQIWDTCCDHGYLGEAYLQRNQGRRVHFVDRVEALMCQIDQRLSSIDNIFAQSKWQIHCIDVKQLNLASGQTHLVVVAGVGGDLCADIVEAIMTKHPTHDIDWILCPVHKHETLRKKLLSLHLNMVNESLVKDKGRIYEVIHVNKWASTPVSIIGHQIWQANAALADEYLAQKIAHFARKANSQNREAIDTLAALKAVAEARQFLN